MSRRWLVRQEALAAELVTHKRLGEKRVREVIKSALHHQLAI